MGTRATTIIAALGCVGLAAAPAAAQCMLCAAQPGSAGAALKPLTVEIETTLDFSRVGLVRANQGGTVAIDAGSGQKTISGSLVDLGGLAMQGTATVRGSASQAVKVDMPGSVTLTSADGATLELSNFQTNLGGSPRLGVDGVLRFSFGARLKVDGRSDGIFRGSIPITVDYR